MINPQSFQLSTEQQFQLQCLQNEFKHYDRNAVISHLLDAIEQIMVRDNLIRNLLKQ